MIEKVSYYQCNYCRNNHETMAGAIQCLNDHPIVFVIEKLVGDHDCWGRYESDWGETNNVFKSYEKALEYVENSKYLRIKYKELKG